MVLIALLWLASNFTALHMSFISNTEQTCTEQTCNEHCSLQLSVTEEEGGSATLAPTPADLTSLRLKPHIHQ
uniref:Uncharacterized protein n=1 Tax=Anguilla anguilla TaxID=7936 RepID=A0A0E9R0F3_ANGAN